MAKITDGTANTLMMSEYLIAYTPIDEDWRGDIHNDEGVFRFHTIQTPRLWFKCGCKCRIPVLKSSKNHHGSIWQGKKS